MRWLSLLVAGCLVVTLSGCSFRRALNRFIFEAATGILEETAEREESMREFQREREEDDTVIDEEALIDALEDEITEEQAAKLAFGAVLAARNNLHYDTLFGSYSIYRDSVAQTMVFSWGISDRDSALQQLNWLLDEGHRMSTNIYLGYDEVYAIIRDDPAKVRELPGFDENWVTGYNAVFRGLVSDFSYTAEELAAVDSVSAWDYDRLVTLTRWCYGVGYITEEEAWAYIDAAAELAVADYGSWREYFAGVMFGRTIWSGNDEFSIEDRSIAMKLLENEDSIYNRAAFAVG